MFKAPVGEFSNSKVELSYKNSNFYTTDKVSIKMELKHWYEEEYYITYTQLNNSVAIIQFI